MEYQITFLRHGSSEGLEKNLLQGNLDFPLSCKGREECKSLAEYWKKKGKSFDLVITSSLVRASETGRIIAETLCIPLESEEIWIERCFGEAQGIDREKVDSWYEKMKRPGNFEPLFNSGESEWELHLRAGKALGFLLQRDPGHYLVVSHGNFLNAVFHMIFGLIPSGTSQLVTMPLNNSGFASFRYVVEDERWYMDEFIQSPHLSL